MEGTNQYASEEEVKLRPLTFHIRRHRLWYRKASLTQGQLAELAGLSRRVVARNEHRHALPQSIASFLKLALALDVPAEALIAPDLLESLKQEVEVRRRALRLDQPPGLASSSCVANE